MKAYCHHCKLPGSGHPTPDDCVAALLAEIERLRTALEMIRHLGPSAIVEEARLMASEALEPRQ